MTITRKQKEYLKNREKYLSRERQKKINAPWKIVFNSIKYRCTRPSCERYENYGGRGIKCLISVDEIKELWFRDKAYLMKKPSIDREDNDGHYTFTNCRFIEYAKNTGKDKCKMISRFTLTGEFVKTYESARQAMREDGFSYKAISRCLIGHSASSGGCKWRYTNV